MRRGHHVPGCPHRLNGTALPAPDRRAGKAGARARRAQPLDDARRIAMTSIRACTCANACRADSACDGLPRFQAHLDASPGRSASSDPHEDRGMRQSPRDHGRRHGRLGPRKGSRPRRADRAHHRAAVPARATPDGNHDADGRRPAGLSSASSILASEKTRSPTRTPVPGMPRAETAKRYRQDPRIVSSSI